MRHLLYYILAASACLASCRPATDPATAHQSAARRADEQQGGRWLAEARAAMGQRDWGAARARVDSIRLRTPLALDAREDAILLLDSVELLSAQAELTHTDSLIQAGARSDSLTRLFELQMEQVKFYHRKLDYDRGNRKTH